MGLSDKQSTKLNFTEECRSMPFGLVALSAQIAVFIFYAVEINRRLEQEPWNRVTLTSGYPFFSPLSYDPTRRKEAWRYITYMFIHEGILHILFNSLGGLLLGLLIEWVNKFWRVAPVYLAGVLAGSLAASVFDPFAGLVGASGGLYALIGAHLALVVLNWEEMQHDWTSFCSRGGGNSALAFFASGVVRLVLIFVFIGVDFGVALFRRYGLNEVQNISFMAHLGGFVAGLLLGIPVLRNIDEKPWERVVFWISLVLFILMILFAVLWNIFYPGFPTQVV